jgi:hypothetical protein
VNFEKNGKQYKTEQIEIEKGDNYCNYCDLGDDECEAECTQFCDHTSEDANKIVIKAI